MSFSKMLIAAAVLCALAGHGEADELKDSGAFAIGYAGRCTGDDEYISAPGNAVIGSGQMPNRPFTIIATDVAHNTRDGDAYLVVGITGGNGDFISRRLIGQGSALMQFPAGIGRRFDPKRQEIHIHWRCSHWRFHNVYVTVFYVLDSSYSPIFSILPSVKRTLSPSVQRSAAVAAPGAGSSVQTTSTQ